MPLEPGQSLAHYRIIAPIGAGGMGEVYRATDTKLGRDVALKVLPPELASNRGRLERFQREAKALAALDHSGIVTVYSVEEADDVHFLTMQLVEGTSLDRIIPEAGFPIDRLLEFGTALAEALAAAHEKGIVHRDLKPANIMVSESGQLKVLDFGLAKLTTSDAEAPSEIETAWKTREGAVMGTPPYMSPEQIQGRGVDERTDLFSFGVILYEMASGHRPFGGSSSPVVASAILRETPRPLNELRPDLPDGLVHLINRCLEKNPDQRGKGTREAFEELRALRSASPSATSGPVMARRRPRVAFAAAAALILLLAALGWFAWRSNRASWARNQALPEVERLATERQYADAMALAERARRFIPEDPILENLWSEISVEIEIESEPSGASVEIRPYAETKPEARQLRTTPIRGLRVPKGNYRWRFSRQGSDPIERAGPATSEIVRVTLPPQGSVPDGMVLVPKADDLMFVAAFGLPREVSLDDYLIQRFEVTNREFKRFVDDGGYRRKELWKHPFVDGATRFTWEEAMKRFVDKAGQPGPATWEVGSYPEGQDDWPVGGVSWYEASAYAEFVGLSLPTMVHWFRAAGPSAGPMLLPVANFDYRGPEAVGASGAMSPFGTYDMAGNVREWLWNISSEGLRYNAGGGWGDPEYMFGGLEARSPFERAPQNGFRCVRYPDGKPDERSARVFDSRERDYRLVPPVSDETYALFKRVFQYPATPLDARVEKTIDTDPSTRVERVSLSTVYDDNRVVVYLWIPKDVDPPYQTLVIFPGTEGFQQSESEVLERPDRYDFLVRSGRAMVHPVYQGMYERHSEMPGSAFLTREHRIRMEQDFRHTLDYLETRPDIDEQRIGYLGSSLGAYLGPIPLALEHRLSLGILIGGGLLGAPLDPEVDTITYLPHVTVPVLFLCGRYDYFFPYEASQKPFFERLGTPSGDKRHVVVDSAHSVPRSDYLREVLDWLDRYYGAAR